MKKTLIAVKTSYFKKKPAFWGIILTLVIFVTITLGGVYLKHRYLGQLYPLLTDSTEFYLVAQDADFFTPFQDLSLPILEQNISYFEEITALLQLLSTKKGVRAGIQIDQSGISGFSVLPPEHEGEEAGFELNTPILEGYQQSIHEFYGKKLLIISNTRGDQPVITDSRRADELFSIDKQQSGQILWDKKSINRHVHGAIFFEEEILLIRGKIVKSSFSELFSAKMPKGEMVLQIAESIESNAVLEKILPFAPIGTMVLTKGSVENWIESPFQEDLSWYWQGDSETGESLRGQISLLLAKLFPQAIEYMLPDGTDVLELTEEPDYFSGEQINDKSIITYPNGQLFIESKSGGETISHNFDEISGETVVHPCILPAAILSGYDFSTADQLMLWKRWYFSYNQHEFVFCVQ